MIKIDKRVERTRNAILSAFRQLIIEEDLNKITIKQLALKANINRKTFYLHYNSMEELLFDLTVEYSDQIFELLCQKGFFDVDYLNIESLIDTLDEIITNNEDMIKKIITSNSYHFFIRNIKDMLKDSFVRKLKNKTSFNEKTLNLIGDFIASGLAKIMKDWFEDPGNLTARDIATITSHLIYNGVSGLKKLDNDKIKA